MPRKVKVNQLIEMLETIRINHLFGNYSAVEESALKKTLGGLQEDLQKGRLKAKYKKIMGGFKTNVEGRPF